jgi:hypothetical protein
MLLVLYLPLSILAALAMCRMDGGNISMKGAFLMTLIVTGSASMGVVLYSYAGAWGLPQEDYDAIMWLSGQNLSDAVCINLDETGAWVYPFTGIMVAKPRVIPTGFSYGLPERIAKDPGDSTVLEELKGIGHQNTMIYVSSISITRPGHIPPFAEYNSVYPEVNLSFPDANYELLYDKGARIYRVRA